MAALPKRAERAINNLAWQGAVQFAIKASDLAINALANDAMTRPEYYGQRGPGYRRYLKLFSKLGDKTGPRDLPGHYRNKTAVVYTITVVEEYLKEVYKNRKWRKPGGVGFGSYFHDVRKNRLTNLPSGPVDGVHFLIEVRNAIIHDFGVLKADRKKDLKKLRDRFTWPTDAEFEQDFRRRSKHSRNSVLCLDIIKVVIPGIVRSIEYVQAVEAALKRKR